MTREKALDVGNVRRGPDTLTNACGMRRPQYAVLRRVDTRGSEVIVPDRDTANMALARLLLLPLGGGGGRGPPEGSKNGVFLGRCLVRGREYCGKANDPDLLAPSESIPFSAHLR